jgi:hypothetical protein
VVDAGDDPLGDIGFVLAFAMSRSIAGQLLGDATEALDGSIEVRSTAGVGTTVEANPPARRQDWCVVPRGCGSVTP